MKIHTKIRIYQTLAIVLLPVSVLCVAFSFYEIFDALRKGAAQDASLFIPAVVTIITAGLFMWSAQTLHTLAASLRSESQRVYPNARR